MLNKNIINILTVDVEDYFQVENFKKSVKFSDWENFEDRVPGNVDKVLGILERHDVKATFFVLGWTAEKFPQLVKKIHDAGHEIACHGYAHELIYKQKCEEFRADVVKAKTILEKIIGEPVLGYRAPSFSIKKESAWALDILAEEGFGYDSSIFPIRRDRGGMPGAVRYPYRIDNKRYVGRRTKDEGRFEKSSSNELWEIPISTVRIFGQNLAFSGGGYFRLLPYKFIKWGIEQINKDEQPAVVYIHPWEFDPEQPKIKADFVNSFRHCVNLNKTEKKFENLLNDFGFGPINESKNSDFFSLTKRKGVYEGKK